MLVERCPACGARYNVSRLTAGARFGCRRCGGSVRVGGEEPPLGGERPLGGLETVAVVVVGVALSLLMLPSPGMSTGLLATIRNLPLPDVTTLCVTVAIVLLAIGSRVGSTTCLASLAAAAIFLVSRSEGPESGALGTGAPDAANTWARIAIGGGAAILARRGGAASGWGRGLTLLGALAWIAALAAREVAGGPGLSTMLAVAGDEFARFWFDVVWRGGPWPSDSSPWDRVIPFTFEAAAAVLGLLLAILPVRRGGGLSRSVARSALFLSIAAILAPALARAWEFRDGLLAADGAHLGISLARGAVVERGLATWTIGVVALAATLRTIASRTTADRVAISRAPSRAMRVLVAAASLGTLFLFENPTFGVVALRWPLDFGSRFVLDAPAVVAILLAGLALIAFLGALVPSSRGPGAALAGASLLALCAGEAGAPLLGVPRATLPLLIAAGGGLLWAHRGERWERGGRLALWVPALALLGFLLWPRDLVFWPWHSPEVVGVGSGIGWPCAATSLVAGVFGLGGAAPAPGLVLEPASAVAACALVLVLVLMVALAVGPRPFLGLVGLACALAAILEPPIRAFVVAATSSGGGSDSVPHALATAAADLRLGVAPAFLGVLVAAMEAAGRERIPSGNGPVPADPRKEEDRSEIPADATRSTPG